MLWLEALIGASLVSEACLSPGSTLWGQLVEIKEESCVSVVIMVGAAAPLVPVFQLLLDCSVEGRLWGTRLAEIGEGENTERDGIRVGTGNQDPKPRRTELKAYQYWIGVRGIRFLPARVLLVICVALLTRRLKVTSPHSQHLDPEAWLQVKQFVYLNFQPRP